MSINDKNVLAEINDLLACGSKTFGGDAIEMLEFVKRMKGGQFSDDRQLDKQFQVCSLVASFLAWATIHREDFEELTTWWSREIAQDLLNEEAEKRNGRTR